MTVIQMPDQPSTALEERHAAIEKIRSDEFRDQIKLALPESLTVDRFTRATVTAMMANHDLLGADRESLLMSVIRCAQDGLMPDGREAALVIYKTKVTVAGRDTWIQKVQYLPMIAGVRKTAAEFGWTIRTHVVYANDQFEVEQGTDDRIMHKPTPIGADRGDLVAAYAIAHHRDGRRSITEVMRAEDVEKAKAVSKTDAVWKRWPAQMWEKTVGHRIAKKLPLDPVDQQRLTRILDAVDLGPAESARMLYGPGAEASFSELPSGTHPYVNRPDIEVPPADAPADTDGPTATTPVEPDSAPSGSSDPDQPEAPEEAPESAPAAAAAPILEAPDEEAVMLAAEAAEFVPSSGRYAAGESNGPLNLAGILDLGDDGRAYLTMCLARLDAGAWRSATEAFARVHMPVEYAAMLADRSKAA